MFVVVVIPLVDVRSMVAEETGRTKVPFWPDPGFGDEFVRGFGPLRPRRRRGVSPWPGEAHFVAVRRGVRVGEPPPGRDGLAVRPIYRRLYSDGTVGRLEVGFAVKQAAGRRNQQPLDIWDLTHGSLVATAETQTEVGSDNSSIRLVDAGDSLARSLLQATTATRRRPAATPTWWMSAGVPLLVFECRTDELRTQPALRGMIEAKLSEDGPPAVLVDQRWFTTSSRRVSGWSLVSDARRGRDLARQIRVHITRLHSGVEALRAVLRLVRSRSLTLGRAPDLYDFLDQQAKLILRREFGGLSNRVLIERVLDTMDDAYSDEIIAINHSLVVVSKGIQGQMHDVGTILAAAPEHDRSPVIMLNQGSVINMDNSDNSDNSLSIPGGTVGQAQAGRDNIQSGDVHQVTMSSDLRDLVRAVDDAINLLATSIPTAELEDGRDLVHALKGEVESVNVDEPRLRRGLARLRVWAEQVGAVAEPVLSLVAKITKALG